MRYALTFALRITLELRIILIVMRSFFLPTWGFLNLRKLPLEFEYPIYIPGPSRGGVCNTFIHLQMLRNSSSVTITFGGPKHGSGLAMRTLPCHFRNFMKDPSGSNVSLSSTSPTLSQVSFAP